MTQPPGWRCGGLEFDLTAGLLVGVLNVTPDSFSDGGLFTDPPRAIAHGLELVQQGAGLIDVGGESTRPQAGVVSEDEELSRVVPVVSGLVAEGVSVSIDTYKPAVATTCLDAGAIAVNDVSGMTDPGMFRVVEESDCGVVIMHGRKDPTRDLGPQVDVVEEVGRSLSRTARRLVDTGVDPRRIVIDPGLGFAKRSEQSAALLGGIGRLAQHGFTVMIGASRKGFLRNITGAESNPDRDTVTAATTALGYMGGARVFRVHNVAASRGALALAAAIVSSQ